MVITASIKRTGNGLQKLRVIAKKKFPMLEVGVFENSKYLDGMQVAQVAYWMEFGTAHIPPRAAFRLTLMESAAAWAKEVADYAKHSQGMEYDKIMANAFSALGQIAEQDLKNKIGSNIPPPLKAETVERKRKGVKESTKRQVNQAYIDRARTLVDTGTYQRSIQHGVRST